MYEHSEIYFKPATGSLKKLVTKNFLSFKPQEKRFGLDESGARDQEDEKEKGVPCWI